MLGGFLSRVLLLDFGYAYPAYECYKTVELNKPEIEHLIFWCQYWILVSLLTVLERFGDVAVSWLPLYSEAKLMFFIYLWCPKTKGTTYVYETFFRPYISQHENDIDRNILEFRATSPSQLSRPHPSQQRSESQKQQKSQPPQQQQVPQKQPTTLRRAASAAARQEQSQEIQTAATASKSRRLTTAKSAPLASAKSIPVASTAKLVEETKTSPVNVAAEEATGPVSNANVPIRETNASLPESETDDMVIDEDVATPENTNGGGDSSDPCKAKEACCHRNHCCWLCSKLTARHFSTTVSMLFDLFLSIWLAIFLKCQVMMSGDEISLD